MIIVEWDYLYLGSAPAEEDCKSVGIDTPEELREEAVRFLDGLRKLYDNQIQEWCGFLYFDLEKCDHDFGTYWDVVLKYDGRVEEVKQLALSIEKSLPLTWAELERE